MPGREKPAGSSAAAAALPAAGGWARAASSWLGVRLANGGRCRRRRKFLDARRRLSGAKRTNEGSQSDNLLLTHLAGKRGHDVQVTGDDLRAGLINRLANVVLVGDRH